MYHHLFHYNISIGDSFRGFQKVKNKLLKSILFSSVRKGNLIPNPMALSGLIAYKKFEFISSPHTNPPALLDSCQDIKPVNKPAPTVRVIFLLKECTYAVFKFSWPIILFL